jgi:hypothetical protein
MCFCQIMCRTAKLLPAQWLRFFQLMGSVVAIKEGTNRVAGTPEDMLQVLDELRAISADLDVINRLTGFGAALTHVSERVGSAAHYFLVQLDLDLHQTSVTGFTPRELATANEQYLAAERDVSAGKDAVLVSVENLAVLQRAYPNYFLDTRMFLDTLRDALLRRRLRRRRVPLPNPRRRRKSAG